MCSSNLSKIHFVLGFEKGELDSKDIFLELQLFIFWFAKEMFDIKLQSFFGGNII